MLYSFAVFLPTIVRAIGDWSVTEVQALTTPVYTTGAVVYLVNARLSDATQRRSYFIIGATFVSIFGYALLIANRGPGLSYAVCFFVKGYRKWATSDGWECVGSGSAVLVR
ncbi:hypothetical protein ACHAQH_006358 [Verticillium albo-atrum]